MSNIIKKYYTQILLYTSLLFSSKDLLSQTIGTFSSVTPTVQTQNLVLPGTHTFQRIIKSGDALSLGGTLGANTDFTGYVPIIGSSTNGYLSISNETTPAGCAILGISYNYTNHTWTVNNGGIVPFVVADIGNTARFCSGTVTPNNTIIVCEEDVTTGDANSDGYTDRGWLIEIDPATRTVINQTGGNPNADKLWAVGRSNHENAAITGNNMVLYTGADDASLGYLYKFIPATAGNFSSGTLYVLQTTGALGNGTWRLLANTTQADRNNTRTLSTTAGAYNFNGIEDVEIGPDGKIYFAAKNEGKVYRFTDNGTFGTATDISSLEVFVGNDAYPTRRSYDIDGAGTLPLEPWDRGNDNLAFDGEGNLWVCQDAIETNDRNHIWVVGPTHTQASPQVKVFATTPVRSEPTGITFSPDYKFMFISFMGPNANTTPQTDAAGTSVIFSTSTTVVIARIENLGPLATLALTFNNFDIKEQNNAALLNWAVSNVSNHSHFEIERSANGRNFEKIYTEYKIITNGSSQSFNFTDKNVPVNTVSYYRIKQVNRNGSFQYSEIKSISINSKNTGFIIYPVPAGKNLNIAYRSEKINTIMLTVLDAKGQALLFENKNILPGENLLQLDLQKLSKGNYTLVINDEEKTFYGQQFIKL
jgi:secreted PhoX family phosphatase